MMRRLRLTVLGATVLSALLYAAPAAPVADAAMQGNKDAVRLLLKQAADVNAAQGDGMTALHWAAMNDDAEIAQTLLYAGASVRATTRIGAYTPLILAAKNGGAAVMEPLLKAGADVNTQTSNGTTALMLAAASGSTDAVTLLIDRGADVNAKEPVRGLTAAMFAAASNRASVLDLLARRGADLRAASKVTDLAALSRDDQRTLRPRQIPPRQRRGPDGDGRERRDGAVRGAELRMGAQGALSAAACADQPEDDLPRSDEGAARQRRRPEHPSEQEDLVL